MTGIRLVLARLLAALAALAPNYTAGFPSVPPFGGSDFLPAGLAPLASC